MGTLFYSMAMSKKGRGPFCLGVSQAMRQEVEVDGVEVRPPDALGDFKYACLGYSIHHAKGKNRNGSVQLPQCEGLEVLATTAAPGGEAMLMEESGTTGQHHESDGEVRSIPKPSPWPMKNVTEREENVGKDFGERFVRMAGLIVKKGKELSTRILGF